MSKKDEINTEIKNEKTDNSEVLKKTNDENEVTNLQEKITQEVDETENLSEEKSSEEILQNEIEQLRDEKLRLLAEMENLRKRVERDKIDTIRYGSINLARDILSPDDNLTRALEALPQEEKNSDTVNNLIDGLKMVQKEFATILEKYGIKKIDALNSKFDHNFHQAMVEIENDEVEPGIVIQEMQSGYTMHDRLLRPSMVGVSKKTTKNDEDKKKS